MLKHELTLVWITSDGEKFLNKDEAIIHEKHLQSEKEVYERIKKCMGI